LNITESSIEIPLPKEIIANSFGIKDTKSFDNLSITDASFITTLFLPKTEKVLLQHFSLIIKGRGI
jgi:hypothetical protein